MRTIDNIYMHEIIGLNGEIVKASNKNHVGLEGKIVYETKNTFVIMSNNKEKTIPKKCSHIKIMLNETETILNGDMLITKPHERTKKLWLKRKKWRKSI